MTSRRSIVARDPLADPEPLIQRVHAYVAYRLGAGGDADDVTGTTFERAVRYRASYDPRRGEPIAWLLGIAARCVNDVLAARVETTPIADEEIATDDIADDAIRRIAVRRAVARLRTKDRELIALRYGADLPTRQIAALLGGSRGSVDVALHRALGRLRAELERDGVREPAATDALAEPAGVRSSPPGR